MFWKIVMVLGIVGTLLGLLVAIVSIALVPLTNGRTRHGRGDARYYSRIDRGDNLVRRICDRVDIGHREQKESLRPPNS